MATIAASYRTRPIAFAGGCLNEVHKGLLGLAAGRLQTLIQMVTFPIFYLLIVLFMGSGRLREDLLLPTLLGMVALTFIHEQVNRMFWSRPTSPGCPRRHWSSAARSQPSSRHCRPHWPSCSPAW
jgi:hypothetical protein